MVLLDVLLDVRPSGYADAARVIGDTVAECTRLAWVGLQAALDGTAGMAGSDDVGSGWGSAYDAATEQAAEATEAVCLACYQVAALLEQTGLNYDAADLASVPGSPAAVATTRWLGASVSLTTAASSVGGSGIPAPAGWSLLQHAIGRLWPNGHQDRLHSAAHAWERAGDQLDALSPDIRRAASELLWQRAPELDDALTVIDGLTQRVVDLAESYRRIGASCRAYAEHIDAAHHSIIEEVKSFIEWTVGIEAAGGLFAVFSLGLSELAAQAGLAAEIRRAAEAIKAFIEALRAAALSEQAAVEAAGVDIVAVSDKLAPILAKRVEQARLESVSEQGAIKEGQALVTQAPQAAATTPEAAALAHLAEAAAIGPASETWADLSTLDDHFGRHGMEVGATSTEDYALKAAEFYRRGVAEKLPTRVEHDGTLRIYDPQTNTFGSYTPAGQTKTFFKPTSRTYFDRQRGTLR